MTIRGNITAVVFRGRGRICPDKVSDKRGEKESLSYLVNHPSSLFSMTMEFCSSSLFFILFYLQVKFSVVYVSIWHFKQGVLRSSLSFLEVWEHYSLIVKKQNPGLGRGYIIILDCYGLQSTGDCTPVHRYKTLTDQSTRWFDTWPSQILF